MNGDAGMSKRDHLEDLSKLAWKKQSLFMLIISSHRFLHLFSLSLPFMYHQYTYELNLGVDNSRKTTSRKKLLNG